MVAVPHIEDDRDRAVNERVKQLRVRYLKGQPIFKPGYVWSPGEGEHKPQDSEESLTCAAGQHLAGVHNPTQSGAAPERTISPGPKTPRNHDGSEVRPSDAQADAGPGDFSTTKATPDMDLYDSITDLIERLKADYLFARQDGKLTFAEITQLFASGVEALVDQAELLRIPGAEKKALVMAAVEKLYDTLIAPFDIPYIPEFIERSIVDPALRKLVLAGADGFIEWLVKKLPPTVPRGE